MEGLDVAASLTIVLAAAALAAAVVRWLRAPVILGYLLAGVVIGPSGLALLESGEQIEGLAEMGVALLLFSIGLEMSPRRLWDLRVPALVGGGLQVLLTIVAAGAVALLFGVRPSGAVVVGFVAAVSSTAIVLKALAERAELDSPHGRIALAVLIFQDLVVVPMVLAIPFLAGRPPEDHTGRLLIGAVGVVLLLTVGRKVVSWALDRVAASRSREAFLLTVAVVLLGTAWFTVESGLSMALGAFLAGLLISDTEHRLLALSESVPFRDLFSALFFVSVGMLLELGEVVADPLPPLLIALGLLVLKSGIVGAIVRLLGWPSRTAVLSGLALAQIGEFSFLILVLEGRYGILPEDVHGELLSAAILSMVLTPVVMALAPRVADRLSRRRGGEGAGPSGGPAGDAMDGHVVIVGFGLIGRTLAGVLKATGIPYRVVELNPATVRREREQGEPILRGDSTRLEVLEHAGVARAQAVVIAVNDREAARMSLQAVKQVAPDAWVALRAHYFTEMDELYRMGADEVVPEEFETAIEIFSRVLLRYEVPRSVILREVDGVRGARYGALREGRLPAVDALLTGLEVTAVRLGEEDHAAGHTLVELDLRARTGAQALAVVRRDALVPMPARERLAPGDTVVLSGIAAACAVATRYLHEGADALE